MNSLLIMGVIGYTICVAVIVTASILIKRENQKKR